MKAFLGVVLIAFVVQGEGKKLIFSPDDVVKNNKTINVTWYDMMCVDRDKI